MEQSIAHISPKSKGAVGRRCSCVCVDGCIDYGCIIVVNLITRRDLLEVSENDKFMSSLEESTNV